MCRIICAPNARMCGWDCKPVLHHPQTIRILFAVNQNLLVSCANTKRTGCARCPFHTPGVLYSPQIHGKLSNHAPNTRRMRTAQRVSGVLVYTRFNVYGLNTLYTIVCPYTFVLHPDICLHVLYVVFSSKQRIFWGGEDRFCPPRIVI